MTLPRAKVRDTAARNELAEKYVPLVWSILRRMRRLYPAVRRSGDEALSAGFMALLRAAEIYDERRAVSFARYARKCITAKMMDAIYSVAVVKIPSTLRKSPAELARGPNPLHAISLFASPDRLRTSPVRKRSDVLDRLDDAIGRLKTDQQKQVVRLLFWDGLTQDEVAEMMGVHHSRVWYIRKVALKHLADLMSQ